MNRDVTLAQNLHEHVFTNIVVNRDHTLAQRRCRRSQAQDHALTEIVVSSDLSMAQRL